jgi:hypothetical protein
MNTIVKIIRDDEGALTKDEHWHLVDPANPQGNAALCTQEFFGPGESDVEYELKVKVRGGINCAKCIRIIKIYKAVRL